MESKDRIKVKTDYASVTESLRLADNYHKNRLIDPLEAYRHYNERMEVVHGCNKGKTPFYNSNETMLWSY